MGGGSKGFKGGSGSGTTSYSPQPNPYADTLAKLAGQLYTRTDPIREGFLLDWMNFLGYSPDTNAFKGTYGTLPGSASSSTTTTQTTPTTGVGGWYPGQMNPQATVAEGDTAGKIRQFIGNLKPNENLTPIPAGQLFNYGGNIVGGEKVRQVMEGGTPKFYLDGVHTVGEPLADRGVLPGIGLQEVTPYQMTGGGSTTTTTETAGSSPASQIASKKYNPYALPGYAPIYDLSRGGLESQYNVAKQNVLGGTRGGMMSDALNQLETSRAQAVGSLPAQISTGLIQDIVNKAYGAAWNAPQQTYAGLGSSANTLQSGQNAAMQANATQNLANQQAKTSGLGMLGLGTGNLLGQGLGSGWITKGLGSLFGSSPFAGATASGSVF